MESIRFVKEIALRIPFTGDIKIAGDCFFFRLTNGNRAKMYCESNRAIVEIINVCNGKIDVTEFPFKRYFEPVKCSATAPAWVPHIDNGEWYFASTYPHCAPKEDDYQKIASAIAAYMSLFGEAEEGACR